MAAVASRNAALARSQIGQTGIAGANEANAIRERGERAISSATAGYGTMGVTADSGSATDVQAGMAERTERNAQVMTQNAMLKQWHLATKLTSTTRRRPPIGRWIGRIVSMDCLTRPFQ